MAAGGTDKDFNLVIGRRTEFFPGYDLTLACHLSPETSAVAMEIRWFRETDCIYLYKNGHEIVRKDFEGIVSVDPQELQRGGVSLRLKGIRGEDRGYYTCQVISGEHKKERRVEVAHRSLFGRRTGSEPVESKVDREITAEERTKMEESVQSLALTLTQRMEREELERRDQLEGRMTSLERDLGTQLKTNRQLEERDNAIEKRVEQVEEREKYNEDRIRELEETVRELKMNRNHQTGQHFIDTHRTALIQRVNMVNPVLDRLLQWKVISGEDYDLIRSRSPRQEQMRSLLNHGNIRKSQRGKDLL